MPPLSLTSLWPLEGGGRGGGGEGGEGEGGGSRGGRGGGGEGGREWINCWATGLTSQDYFPRYKDEKHYSWLYHPVDEPWEQLWFIAGEGGREGGRGYCDSLTCQTDLENCG